MADNFKNIKNLDIPFKEFMPGQIISSTQFNDDMGEIEEKINEIVGEHNSVANTVVEHLNNISNPHQVTAHQVGAYTTDETDGLFEEVRNGELNDNAIKNRVLADDCVENRNIKDRTITATKVDEGFGSQLDISENIEITDRYTKAEVDEIVQNRVGDGTYTKEELDQKFQDVQVGQIIDKTISADKVTSDFGDNVDISNNPSIVCRYTKSEVDRLISTNGLPRDWGSISDKPTDVENRIGSLPVAGYMVAGQFTSPATSVLDVDVKENVEARGEYNSVGERLNGVDSQIKDIRDRKIDDITLSGNSLTLLANNNAIKTINLPTSSTGTGGSGRTLVVDYTHNSNTVIQPISLDLATGIYTTESVIEVADETLVCWTYNDKLDVNPMYLPYELFNLNAPTTWVKYKLKKISDTTFKLAHDDGTDFVYASDKNTSVNVSKFHFETNSGSILRLDDIELDGDFEIVCEGQSVSNNYSFELNGYNTKNVNYIWSTVNQFFNSTQGPIVVAGESFGNVTRRHRYHEKIIYKVTRKDDLISIDGICIMNYLVKYAINWNTNAGIYYNNAYAKQIGNTSVINKIQMMNNNFGYLLLNGYNIRIYKV